MAVRDANGVPVLALSNSSTEYVAGKHAAALDPDDPTAVLVGVEVYLHNKRPVGAPDTPSITRFVVGGSTLDEALKEIVGAYEFHAHHEQPDWVASSDEDLANLLAEHYDTRVKELPKTGFRL